MAENSAKKDWVAPTFVVYGSVEELTECNKTLGSSDGNTFQGLGPIVCTSSSTG